MWPCYPSLGPISWFAPWGQRYLCQMRNGLPSTAMHLITFLATWTDLPEASLLPSVTFCLHGRPQWRALCSCPELALTLGSVTWT